ncbi:uncharacterized protein BO80DRAFT_443219 [Aspergillus ibericus CBS 121593]|uniref:Uncharacterized protein n=1 Tax=Aspergillus ibericus CBS 121593 TaxID=1448316 RepID=A0A395H7W1_9EURO|nr:hypothetical protein BO80DRAFT_443219 [Aspergillus ibericus CBS 121593]RAL02968.1 hypothetical protein BO80DRAFT_443219 [Aspergillus ibericus CBS 121593]
MSTCTMLSASSSTDTEPYTIQLRPYSEHDKEEKADHHNAYTPCRRGCGSLISDALDGALAETSYTNISVNSPLRGGYAALKRLIDPIERLSLCEVCPKEEAYRNFLHTVCDGIVRQYKHFYQVLFRYFKRTNFEVACCSDDDLFRHDYMILQYASQIDRVLASISRVAHILSEQSVYDGDSWYMVYNQAERLADATYNLREWVVYIRA